MLTSPEPSFFRGRTALVTGASSGIGATISRHLAAAGCRVGILARREDKLIDLASSAEQQGWEVLPIAGDVTSIASLKQAHSTLCARWGPPELVVHAAGSGRDQVFLCDQTEESWTASIDINLNGAFRVCRTVLPALLDLGRGSIVLMSSVAGRRALPANTAYCAARFGLRGLTEALALEAGPAGVRVNALAPGLTRAPSVTDESLYGGQFMASLRKHHGPESLTWERYLRSAVASTALRKMVEPDEVAQAALFLLGPASSAMTGHVLDVDAGSL